MAAMADLVASGDLSVDVEPQSDRDRLGIALHGMVENLRGLVESLRVRDRALASSSSPVVITEAADGPLGTIMYANPAFERLSGYAASELLGRTVDILLGTQAGAPAAGSPDIASEGREIVISHKDGTTSWTEVASSPVPNARGEVTHHVWVLNDISQHKEAEKQAASLANAEKLRALGQMASGIAHDLNQSLMLIASYGHLGGQALQAESLDRNELSQMFTVVTQAALDGGETVKRLLQFARAPVKATPQPLDLTLLAHEVALLTAPRWRDEAQAEGRPITLEVEAIGHPIILAIPAPLREALANLILNAVDALPRGGSIRLRISQRAERAVIEVVDNGIGMTAEVQRRIFEPFFTTKGDNGIGLGLATVFGLVEGLGGKMNVHSAPDQGTTFGLEFDIAPVVAARAATVPIARTGHSKAAPRRLRILAVDDEPALTRAVQRLLRPSGHLVTMASSGEEALERLTAEPFDVVLSDVGMGTGMNGWELAERVRRGWPQIRFALATGWGAAIDPVEAREKGVVAVLAKPYSPAELEAVLDVA
jgi:PAS domain S-box-containing protein